MSAATSTFDVVVPAGCTPGTRFLTTAHGVQMKVRVPPGVQPGQTVRITVDVPLPQSLPKKSQLEQQQQQQQQQQLSAKMAALAGDCPGRHGLQTCLALNPHFRCDVCHCAVPFNAHLRSCRRCNWDVCSQCHTAALAQQQQQQLQQQQQQQQPPPQQQQDQHRVVSDCSTASQAELAAASDCPGHHGLRAFVAPNAHFRCDVCHQAVSLDGLLHACRRCNYDVCDACNSRAAEAVVSESASAAVATAARLPEGGTHHMGSGGGGGGGDDNYDGGDDCHDGDDDHRIANADAPNCPGYHGLAAFIAPSAGFRCDVCRQTTAGRMHGCRRCNWDVCDACMQYPQVCHRQQLASPPQSSAAEAATAETAEAANSPPIPPRPTVHAAPSVPLQATKAASSSSSSSSSSGAAVHSVPLQAPPPRPLRGSGLFVNDAEIAADVVAATPGLSGIPTGQRCWHDPASGAWGLDGGPCLGVFHAGHRIPGAGDLSGDASVRGGSARTGVFVNGRELHPLDVLHFRHLGIACVPGRWTIDALGTIRLEGTPGNTGVVGNVALAALATQQRQQQGRRGVPGGVLSSYDKCGVAVL